jgi:carbamoyl-phosphate synthase large subunit
LRSQNRPEKRAVLVTGCGGGVGQGLIKSLQGSAYEVVGVDSEVLGVGLYAVPRSYLVPYAVDPGYVARLLEICRAEDCKLVLPGLDAELSVLADARERFRGAGIIPVVSSSEVIRTCDDKLATSRFLERHGFPAPQTRALSDDSCLDLPFPLVLKPRRGGARSRGVLLVGDRAELMERRKELDTSNYVAQEHIEGDEYTCGTVNFEGRCRGTITMRRTLRDGDTYKAFVVDEPVIQKAVIAAMEALKPFGACNVQLRMREGRPYIFEINARSSGTTASRTLAGFNEPLMVADYLLENREPEFEIEPISVLRYWQEFPVDSERIEEMSQRGHLTGDATKL